MPIARNVSAISEICTMHILVVSATSLELAPFLSRDTGYNHLVSGVGIPACMYNLQRELNLHKYDLVLQAGIAGTFDEQLPMGETVLVQKDLFADAGANEHGNILSLDDMGLRNKNDYPYTNGWLVNDHYFLQSTSFNKVTAITVGMVSDDEAPINKLLKKKYGATIESMEGAALHYVCLQERVPFLQLRSISNIVGERNKANWKMKTAIDRLDVALEQLLGEIEENKI